MNETAEIIGANLKRRHDEYFSWVEDYAQRLFDIHIKPFCADRGWDFVAGNGMWFLGPSGGAWYPHHDSAPTPKTQRIIDILNVDIPGMPYNDLGSLMPSYHHNGKDTT